MKYLAANIFLLPILYSGEKSAKATHILEKMVQGEIQCATSSLTLDEFVWVIMKMTKDRVNAIESGRDLLQLPNLRILDVTGIDILTALDFMERYPQLKPRDAIHLAVCTNSGIFTIISDDSDYDGIKEIERESLD